ncbi:hypothetical protein N6B35_08780 [Klebsiella michiganensis]|uniref:hypothetical protein n=1 Tax=Klebsiella TaxID=570 RepID=UPI0021D83F89|nr:hypothetical protein [Klebsiella michiganensis]UYB58684.1 hypothetical protein N6B35_08780 [Klebsiella michiganensis]
MSEDNPNNAQDLSTNSSASGAKPPFNGDGSQVPSGNPASGPSDPSFPLAGLPESSAVVKYRAENHSERLIMRKRLFIFIVVSSGLFLAIGAVMSICITVSMVNTKSEVKEAMLEVVKESSPQKISEFVLEAKPAPPESLYHARETAKELNTMAMEQRNGLISKFLETTNWLSLSPMITLIAFILGVGLTLAIALMKALFREEESEEKNNTLTQIATPVSKLIEYLVDYLQSKFKGK